MDDVIKHLEDALDHLESFVPYARRGNIAGEHETWIFKNHLQTTIEIAKNMEEKYGI